MIPAAKPIVAKGSVHVPSPARFLKELREGYAEVPDLSFAAKDGFVTSRQSKPDLFFSGGGCTIATLSKSV